MKNKEKKESRLDQIKNIPIINMILSTGGTVLYLEKDDQEDVVVIETIEEDNQ